MLRQDEDVEGRGNGVRMLGDGGGIICYDREVGCGVARSKDVVRLY